MTCGPSNVEKMPYLCSPSAYACVLKSIKKNHFFPSAHVTKGGPMLYNITSRRICITIADGGCKMRVQSKRECSPSLAICGPRR